MTYHLETKASSRKPIGFYTPHEASRIAQIPLWTINSWRRNGIVIPSVKWTDELKTEHIGHTFETVVFLRLIRLLREKRISLYSAVKAVKQLNERFGYPSKRWVEARIFVEGKDVFVYDKRDNWDTTVVTRGHQKVSEFIFGEEFELLKDRADALLIPSQFMKYVEIDTSIQNGLPIIFNTTILTSLIHSLIQQEYEYHDIHEMYPFISIEKITGAEEYEKFLDRVSLN